MKRTMMRDVAILLVSCIAAVSLGACQQTRSVATGSEIQIAVTENGFEPAEVTVRRGERVTLVVTRKTEKTCATEFVMKGQGIHQPLPLNRPVTIAFTPAEAGELRYACGMDMVAGKVIVK